LRSAAKTSAGARRREAQSDFSVQKPASLTAALGERGMLFQRAVLMSEEGLLMTPRPTGMDGFFVSIISRRRVHYLAGC